MRFVGAKAMDVGATNCRLAVTRLAADVEE